MCHNLTGSQWKDLVERSSSSRQQCKFESTAGFLQGPMWGPLLWEAFWAKWRKVCVICNVLLNMKKNVSLCSHAGYTSRNKRLKIYEILPQAQVAGSLPDRARMAACARHQSSAENQVMQPVCCRKSGCIAISSWFITCLQPYSYLEFVENQVVQPFLHGS